MNFGPFLHGHIHPGVAQVALYCRDLAGDHALPRRSDFRPAKVRSVLGYIFLVDVLHDANDYLYSLFGEHVSVLYGMNLTGKRLSQIGDEGLRGSLRQTYDTAVSTGKFQYLRGSYTWADQAVEIDRLLVPMVDGTGELTTILGISIPLEGKSLTAIRAGSGAAHLKVALSPGCSLGVF